MSLRDGHFFENPDDGDEFSDSAEGSLWQRWGATSLKPVVVAVALTACVMWVLTHMSTMTAPAVISMATGSSIAVTSSDVGESGFPNPSNSTTVSEPPVAQTFVVQILGEVHEPGLVTVPVGARVSDAIAAAGGLLSRTSSGGLNLARRVVDGEQIVVSRAVPTITPASGSTSSGLSSSGLTASGMAPGGTASIDLNAADVAALDSLPGVGPVMAARIIAWRDQHRRFTTVNQLREISGIGPRTFERLRPFVHV